MSSTALSGLLRQHHSQLLTDWQNSIAADTSSPRLRASAQELSGNAREFVQLLVDGLKQDAAGATVSASSAIEHFFVEFSREQVQKGFSADETATFLFSLKKPLFDLVQRESADPATALAMIWDATQLVDKLGLQTVRAFQKTREDVIKRQQEEMLELSTPVVKLWDDVLALPIIGTLDSARTQVVMESLLTRIAETESAIAIIDITGVPTVDTLVAQHLIKTVTAIRLMGAECIISGVRPQIAQTIVHLGVDLGNVTTKANLSDALKLALARTGVTISRKSDRV